MKWLLWKDYRVNRLVFIVALVLLIVPHALAVLATIWAIYHGRVPHDFPMGFVISGMWSVILLQLTLAFMGGNAIAGERIDRSAEFLAYMPVSRGRAVASKLLVALALVPLIWLPNLVIVAFATEQGAQQRLAAEFRSISGIIAVTGLTFFCVAWLFSCLLESPTLSVCAGLIVPILVWLGMLWTVDLLELHHAPGELIVEAELSGETLSLWYGGLCLAISAVCFPAGTLYYLRRVEP